MKKVLLVHGIFMNPLFLSFIARNLKKKGYHVDFYKYPLLPKEKHIKDFYINKVEEYKPNVIIGHSLGGNITIHQMDKIEHSVDKIICLGSPLKGSSIAKEVSDTFLSFVITQPVKEMLNTRIDSVDGAIPVGMIAGTNDRLGMRLIFKALKGESDGTVEVEETKVDNLTDRKELYVGHTSMLFSKDVSEQIVHFIENNSFFKKH